MNNPAPSKPLNPEATLAIPLHGLKLIEASAGTGKTYTIANLYLRYILEGYQVRQILVVTFTKAATEELRGRVHTRLYQALQLFQTSETSQDSDSFLTLLIEQTSDPEAAQRAIDRLRLAVRSMDEAAIFTIHGFCQRALVDHPFQSGQAFEMEFMTSEAELWDEALKDWWRRTTYTRGSIEIHLFSSALGSLKEFIRFQTLYRESGEVTLIPTLQKSLADVVQEWQALRPRLQALATHWSHHKTELIAILKGSPALSRSAKSGYRLDHLSQKLAVLEEYFNTQELLIFPQAFRFLGTTSLHQNSTPTKRGTDPLLQDDFFQTCQNIVDHYDGHRRDLRITALQAATQYAEQRVEQTKQQRATLAFQDQLTRLRKALHGHQDFGDSLTKRFPIALIDEFQDTDAIQYDIFRRLYQDRPNTSMIMIGDPKQAIYSFRGGDIFTYMQARQDVQSLRYTLDTNWRSVPQLIEAMNALFSTRPAPFLYNAIDYLAVLAASSKQKRIPHALLLEQGQPVPPVSLWQIPLNPKNKPLNQSVVGERVVQATAQEIARLLQGGQEGTIVIGQQPVRPGDISVLVRTSIEGTHIRNVLYELGINAVTVGRELVFQSEEAKGLEPLLQAIIHCTDRAYARQALASSLLHLHYQDIAAVLHQETPWLEWLDQLQNLHQLWSRQGFMSMFQVLLQTQQMGLRVASMANADRRLTNLLHLAELMQQASKAHPGMETLLAWYQKQAWETESEEAELRLESDSSLVKIVTIHKSKGLEYPIVFLPFLWNCRPKTAKDALLGFHNAAHHAFVDAGSAQWDTHLRRAEKERLAEDIRLTYVALTRAKAKLYLAWGPVNRQNQDLSGKSALAYLLHAGQQAEELEQKLPAAFQPTVNLKTDFDHLVQRANGGIEVRPLPTGATTLKTTLQAPPQTPLALATFSGKIASDWRIASFSSLTRNIHQTPHGGAPRSTEDPVLAFPAGSHVGSFLHLLLEHLDFQGDIQQQTHALADRYAASFQLHAESHYDTLTEWMQNVVTTPLDQKGLCLHHLSKNMRLNELEFNLSLQQLAISDLNQQLDRIFNQTLTKIEVNDFRGLVTGIIDLVFEYQGVFYLADYKSNYLGGALTDYAPDKLYNAILNRRYDLQYLLYSLALHRYLQQRLDHYDYQQHFGGVYYLFLRGMRPASGPKYGVYYQKPEASLIYLLDKKIFAY